MVCGKISLAHLLGDGLLSNKDSQVQISSVEVDSRKPNPEGVFFCIKGMTVDSHAFIDDAVKHGARCIVHDHPVEEAKERHKDVVFVQVEDSRLALAKAVHKALGSPTEKMKVFGVTGTNGKTTTAYLIYKMLSKFQKSAYNGTIGTYLGDKTLPYSHLTTPDSIYLTQIFRNALGEGVQSMALEVSSHALAMKRAHGIGLDVAIFTNLTRDHLDYHGDIEHYAAAKAEIFKLLKKGGTAVICGDDPRADYFIEQAKKSPSEQVGVFTYGKAKELDFVFSDIALSTSGTQFKLKISKRVMEKCKADIFDGCSRTEVGDGVYTLKTDLISEINIYNLTAAIASLLSIGLGMKEIAQACEKLDVRIGRFEHIPSKDYFAIVDYAHTPDGFESIFAFTDYLKAQLTKTPMEGAEASLPRLITIFGSAGKRDKGKRPKMGLIAAQHSEVIVLTEEDYRDEDPSEIAQDIAKGWGADGDPDGEPGGHGNANLKLQEYYIEPDREKAIALAIEKARKGDILLILGKGNEDFLDRGENSEYWAGDGTVMLEKLKEAGKKRK